MIDALDKIWNFEYLLLNWLFGYDLSMISDDEFKDFGLPFVNFWQPKIFFKKENMVILRLNIFMVRKSK